MFLFTVEKRKENITDLPRQGGQKKKMGEHSSEHNKYYCSIDNLDFDQYYILGYLCWENKLQIIQATAYIR